MIVRLRERPRERTLHVGVVIRNVLACHAVAV